MKPCLALILVACGSATPPTVLSSTATSSGPPEIELVAVSPEHAVFLASQRDGTVAVVRSVDLPFRWLHAHRWFGHDVAVVGIDEHKAPRVGIVGERGFAEVRFPTESWPAPSDPTLNDAETSWSLRSTPSGELWLVRCLGYSYLADKGCVEASYARLLPTRSAPERRASPPADRPAFAIEKVAPPADVHVELVADPLAGQPSSAAYATEPIPPTKILRCTLGGKTSEYPSEEERRFDHDFELSEIVWLSQRPPVFRLTRAMQCNGTCYYGVTFEGCTPSARFENAQLAAGPDGAFALHTDSIVSVRWHGRELGTAEVASEQVSFRH